MLNIILNYLGNLIFTKITFVNINIIRIVPLCILIKSSLINFFFFRLKMKQNRYPVLFLTQGVTTRYPSYDDPRCHTIKTAVYHSSCHDLLVNLYDIFFVKFIYNFNIL